ncbi:L-threonylcarbamoyladenylate synthase [Candidatus Uhrbacteria bacterium]|nr:L-threonylcarbamoyladenylate synthase [Candidatus Uhrbacteria bacterium]
MSQQSLSAAIAHLRRGGLLIYPTETSYAIGCDATNARAVRAIFRLKGRERGKSLPLIVASRAMAERYARLTPLARRLTQRHWPGPLTIVVDSRKSIVESRFTEQGSLPPTGRGSDSSFRSSRRAKEERGWGKFAPGVLAPNHTIALRVSSHPIARALSRHLGRPIVSTSANRSGEPPTRSIAAMHRAFGNDPRLRILDGGILPKQKPSTIIDARGRRSVILRSGCIAV